MGKVVESESRRLVELAERGNSESVLQTASWNSRDWLSSVTLGCHGGSRPSEPADAFPDSSSRARMRSAGLAHPVRDDHGSNQFLHSNPSILRHPSQLGVYFRVQRLHKFSCRCPSTHPIPCYPRI